VEQYRVTGMTCAACSARVEKAVRAVEGVDSCAVNLLTNSMVVSGSATSMQIIAAVEHAGYGASLKGRKSVKESTLTDTETPAI
jgi:Cu2+-exporting ATPase